MHKKNHLGAVPRAFTCTPFAIARPHHGAGRDYIAAVKTQLASLKPYLTSPTYLYCVNRGKDPSRTMKGSLRAAQVQIRLKPRCVTVRLASLHMYLAGSVL